MDLVGLKAGPLELRLNHVVMNIRLISKEKKNLSFLGYKVFYLFVLHTLASCYFTEGPSLPLDHYFPNCQLSVAQSHCVPRVLQMELLPCCLH